MPLSCAEGPDQPAGYYLPVNKTKGYMVENTEKKTVIRPGICAGLFWPLPFAYDIKVIILHCASPYLGKHRKK